LIGQAQIISSLRDSYHKENFPHALLFIGNPGYGTLPLALWTAGMLLCRSDHIEKPCGVCGDCLKSAQFIHPDLHVTFPVVKKEGLARKDTMSVHYMKKWRSLITEQPYISLNEWLRQSADKSTKGDINVAECNEIAQRLQMRSFQGGNKVQIIWMAEMLGNNANRLLKIIEEPPQNTYLILVAEDGNRVLNTLKSRCRTYPVPRIQNDDIVKYLREMHRLEAEDAEGIAANSEGDMNMVLEFLTIDSNEMFDMNERWLRLCQGGGIQDMRDWVEAFDQFNHEEKKAVLSYLLKLLRETIHAKLSPNRTVRLGHKDAERLMSSPVFMNISANQINRINIVISEAIYLLDRNVHAKILMFNSTLELESILKKVLMRK
jgi:DNA polymerase-3 subunit delta'